MIGNTKILGFVYLILLISCAQQTSPTGGPKDEDPPILLQSTPKANQLNYKVNVITLTFNEYVNISNPKEQLIITPDIGPNYEIVAKKNKVTLTMENPLRDSTTYAFNFGESVQDITEKNPAENLHIAFSTGATIDSLSISGNVYDLLRGTPLEKMVVAIHQNADTFDIFKHKPSYISRTQKDGKFKIGNLKQGTYYLYAYHDKNRNLIVDSKSERYGFLIAPIILTKDTSNIEIPVSQMDATALKITRARPFNNYFTINLSKNIIDYSLTAVENLDTITSTFGENQANIITYNTTANTDSLFVKLNALDSIGNLLDTTFYIKYSQREVTSEKFSVSTQSTILYADKGIFEAKIKVNKPLQFANLDSLYIYIDSTTQIHLTEEDITFDRKKLILTITKSFDKSILEKPPQEKTEEIELSARPTRKKGEPLTLEERANIEASQKKSSVPKNYLKMGKGALISIDNDSSTSSTANLKITKTVDLSVIIVEVLTDENFVVNLLNKEYNVVKSVSNNTKITFDDLLPSDYILQLIIDKNKNGVWDAGNIFEKREPEPIYFYLYENKTQIIPAKANWEIGPLLIDQ